jgi:hypothetical protein
VESEGDIKTAIYVKLVMFLVGAVVLVSLLALSGCKVSSVSKPPYGVCKQASTSYVLKDGGKWKCYKVVKQNGNSVLVRDKTRETKKK